MRCLASRVLLASLLSVAACGGHDLGSIDDTVGASCTSDRACADRCYQDNGDKFPGGFCSLACLSDNDCPTDTYCIKDAGGVCMFACPAFDCSRLGAGYACRDKDSMTGGKVNVCIGG